MLADPDIAGILLLIVGVVVLFFLIDLLMAGGAMSGGMMGGMGGMMGGLAGGMAGAWWLIVPLLAVVIIGLLFSDALGPIWPTGPTMDSPSDWPIVALAISLVLILVIVALAVSGARGSTNPRDPLSAEEILRERYAKGEINRQQYLDVLVDVLKDRYARGEIELDEYERRLDLLLLEPTRAWRRELERKG